MKSIYNLLVFIFLLHPSQPIQNDSAPHGTYVVSAKISDSQGRAINLIIGDSLCVYGDWAVEAKMRIELMEVLGVAQPPKNKFVGLYLINLKRKSFTEIENLNELHHLMYKPLSEKKTGFDFYGESGLFHREIYKIQDVVYQGEKARKITYTIQGGPYNDKHITIYAAAILNSSRPLALYPQMEKTFKGHIKEIHINLEAQGTLVINCAFSPNIKKEYLEKLKLLQKNTD